MRSRSLSMNNAGKTKIVDGDKNGEVAHVEVSIRGKWIRIAAVDVSGERLAIRGKWFKVAQVNDEWWLESELEEPEKCVQILKAQESHSLQADIFTFTQKLPGSTPKYHYPMEWESVAAARTDSFKKWWEDLPQETRKNVRRSQKRDLIAISRNRHANSTHRIAR